MESSSHTKPPQPFNKIADLLAYHGRMNNINSLVVIPEINNINNMKYSTHRLVDTNVCPFVTLAANFSVAASIESEL